MVVICVGIKTESPGCYSPYSIIFIICQNLNRFINMRAQAGTSIRYRTSFSSAGFVELVVMCGNQILLSKSCGSTLAIRGKYLRLLAGIAFCLFLITLLPSLYIFFFHFRLLFTSRSYILSMCYLFPRSTLLFIITLSCLQFGPDPSQLWLFRVN